MCVLSLYVFNCDCCLCVVFMLFKLTQVRTPVMPQGGGAPVHCFVDLCIAMFDSVVYV